MPADQVTVKLLQQWYALARSVDRALGQALGRLGLTESTGAALWALDPHATPPTMRELARALGCDPSNASLVSAKLEHDGLVERRPHPSDGRARVLALTENGRELRARLIADVAASTPLRHLDRARQRQLSALLAAIDTGE